MKCITQAEYDELCAARDERDRMLAGTDTVELGFWMAQLIQEAERRRLVVTVEQRPLLPLAMGHYEHACSIRPARDLA